MLSKGAPLPPSNGAPNQKHDDCPHGCTYKAGAFARAIPAESLSQIGRHESSHNAKDSGEDEPLGSLSPGVMSFANTPAIKPIKIVHKIPIPASFD